MSDAPQSRNRSDAAIVVRLEAKEDGSVKSFHGAASTMRSKQFEDCARDFMRIATKTKDPTSREQLVAMARLWMEMAVEEEAKESGSDLPLLVRH